MSVVVGSAAKTGIAHDRINSAQKGLSRCLANILCSLWLSIEQFFAIQPVRQRREAAARYARDDVNFVEEAKLDALWANTFSTSQCFENAVRERRGARAAARGREDDETRDVFNFSVSLHRVHAQDEHAAQAQTIAPFQNLNPTPKIGPLNASLSNGWSPWKL
jgi:hypothetical protein